MSGSGLNVSKFRECFDTINITLVDINEDAINDFKEWDKEGLYNAYASELIQWTKG